MIVLNYLLALIGITLLCALWMKFQLWLKRVDPEREGFKPGCGACKGGSCATPNETTIKRENIAPSVKAEFLGKLSGENECREKRSPSSAEVR
jgi:hypothetical protein